MRQCLAAVSVFGLLANSAMAATPSIERDTYLRLHLTAAVDSNCDGDLTDETAENASFGTEKLLTPGQCLIYRTDYSNDGDFAIRKVEVRTPVPEFMVYLPGTASHVETPPGLWPDTPQPPVRGRGGDLVWPFKGGLAPGEAGRVEFTVRLDPVSEQLDFYREASE
jgi:hypothetical protein